jgi:creatinine amidohydrolase
MTSAEFASAVEETGGVCLIAMGVLEKHGDHLPLGTDFIAKFDCCRRAIEKEPAVLYPAFHLGQIHCAKHCPGTIAIKMRVMMDLLENLCDEIARNGLKKIILVNGHGGNCAMLGHFARTMLEEEKDYVVYVCDLGHYQQCLKSDEWKAMAVADPAMEHHGGESETSVLLTIRPEAVKMEAMSPPESGRPLERLSHLPPHFSGIFWYADYPNHYSGDARAATPEKGEWLLEHFSDEIAKLVRAVKADSETKRLQDEFFSRIKHG